MIIIGYPGVGKSIAAELFTDVIDFDPGSFKENKIDFITYCKLAEMLSSQGYTVCVTSHEPVQALLKASGETVYICYPSIENKEFVLKDLEKRYILNPSESSYNAYNHVATYFENDIKEMEQSGFPQIKLGIGEYLYHVLKNKLKSN